MIITIDGPAGSGKSTVARKLAARLGIAYLDTGAMYRAIALAALERGVDPKDGNALVELAQSLLLAVDCGPTHTRVRIDDRDVTEAIRSMAVSEVTSYVARQPAIRSMLAKRQRAIGKQLGSFVTEGRDQGSVVFPQADVKIVLDAGFEKRASRRHLELLADGEPVELEEVKYNLSKRDAIDSKQWAPLLVGKHALVIDTTEYTIPEVVNLLIDEIKRRMPNLEIPSGDTAPTHHNYLSE